jgi:WD40 repeat protein
MQRPLALIAPVFLLVSAAAHAQPGNESGLAPRTFLRIGTTKLRHGDRILCLAYSPDGQKLAAGGGNDPVRIWNPKTGELMREIHEPWAHAMAFTLSGDTLLLAGYQKKIRMWNFKLNKETAQLEGHKATIKALAVSPDTSMIASGAQDGTVILWSMDLKRKVGDDLPAHADEVTALAFSPDKDTNLLATAGSDRVIKLWNTENTPPVLKAKLDAGCGVLAIAFSPDGNTLYSAGDDNLIRRWDVAAGKQTGVFKGHDGIIVSLIAQENTVISGGLDKTIRFWDAKTTKLKHTMPRAPGDSDALAVTSAGDFLATAGTNNTIRIFATGNDQEIVVAPGPQSPLAGLVLSADNKLLAALTIDGRIMIRDAIGPAIEWDARQTGDLLFAGAPDGKTLVTAAGAVRFWNALNGTEIVQLPARGLDTVETLVFSPDGKTIALGYHSAQIELWDWRNKKPLGSFKYPGSLFALAWSPDGKKLVAAGGAKIFVWDPQAKALIKSFDVKEGPAPTFPTVKVLAFGPDSKTLAAGGFDAVVRIYDLAAKNPTDPKLQRLCEGHSSAINALAFSADGRSLISGSFDRTTRLWEAFSGKEIMTYRGHVGPVVGVAFVKDGRSFYTASTDTTILQRDVPGLANNGKLSELTMSFQELEGAWDILATEETLRGHDTLWRCIASAKQAVPHLTKYLPTEDPERVKKLFRDLDSTHFPTRQAAQNELGKKGRWMEGRYDSAIANPPSLEYKRRVEVLKEKLNAVDSPSIARERLRVRRIMLICEQVGSAEAIAALQKLADRGPEEELREEAKASLQRLKK